MPASHQSLSFDRLILSDPSDGVVIGHPDRTELASAEFAKHSPNIARLCETNHAMALQRFAPLSRGTPLH